MPSSPIATGSWTRGPRWGRATGRSRWAARPAALRDSIAWAHAHVDEALAYAMRYGRGIDKDTCRRFVLMYVNDLTLSLGPEGRQALEQLFGRAHRAGALAAIPPIDPV